MKSKLNYLLIIICLQLLFSCSNKKNIDPFIGSWTSYDNDLKISKVDTTYRIEYYDKYEQIAKRFDANKIGNLLSYRDNNGIGRQIKIYIPVNTTMPKDDKGALILDYNDSLHIRLIINSDGDYYKKFRSANKPRLKGFEGAWKMKTKNFADVYSTIVIDSTSKGIQVAWKISSIQTNTSFATFNQGILNIPALGIDGGINVTYFKDCDCITAGNDKYYRYSENDFRFLGRWKNENGEIKISKNGDYYLVQTHLNEDDSFDFLTEVKGNTLQEPLDKYANGKTYTTITFISPGVISDNGGDTKYFNSR